MKKRWNYGAIKHLTRLSDFTIEEIMEILEACKSLCIWGRASQIRRKSGCESLL